MLKDLERFYKRTILDDGNKNNRSGGTNGKAAFLADGSAKNAQNIKRPFVNYSKAFKGLCNKCGKQGHKGIDCRVRPENYVKGHKGQEKNYFKTNQGFSKQRPVYSDKSKVTCYSCNKQGHFARDCRATNNNTDSALFVGMVTDNNIKKQADFFLHEQEKRIFYDIQKEMERHEERDDSSQMTSASDVLVRLALSQSLETEMARKKAIRSLHVDCRDVAVDNTTYAHGTKREYEDMMSISYSCAANTSSSSDMWGQDDTLSQFSFYTEDHMETETRDGTEEEQEQESSINQDYDFSGPWMRLRANEDWPANHIFSTEISNDPISDYGVMEDIGYLADEDALEGIYQDAEEQASVSTGTVSWSDLYEYYGF
jgi:hypothetical protein